MSALDLANAAGKPDPDAAFLPEAEDLAMRSLVDFTHELRTPLHSVLASVELLLDEPGVETSENAKAHLLRLSAAATHLNTLVDRFLTAAVDADWPQLAAPVDLQAVAKQVVSIIYPLAAARGLSINVDVLACCTYVGHAGDLRQIMLNLLGNAVKYTDIGKVGMNVRCDAGQLAIEVWDTGRGIPLEDLPRIFERFYRAPGSEGVKGSGLGLAGVAELVSSLSGSMEVASQEGAGTRFHVCLPTNVRAP